MLYLSSLKRIYSGDEHDYVFDVDFTELHKSLKSSAMQHSNAILYAQVQISYRTTLYNFK